MCIHHLITCGIRGVTAHFMILPDCHIADKFKIPLKEDAVGDSAQYLNSFFSSLVDKLQELHEQAKANLEAALSRIEEETQEAEV